MSEGLEGRSSNPVAVLFDTLLHPDADFGFDYPSVLHWELEQQHYVPHMVLGKGPPGGAWHVRKTLVCTPKLSCFRKNRLYYVEHSLLSENKAVCSTEAVLNSCFIVFAFTLVLFYGNRCMLLLTYVCGKYVMYIQQHKPMQLLYSK